MKLVEYPKLATPIDSGRSDEPLNKLRVEIDHTHGGCSFLTGEYYESGVYVFLTPCRCENGIVGTYWNGKTHTMGYKILLREMSRKSQKALERAAELILPHAQEIADRYSDGNHSIVYNYIMKLYNKK